MSRGHFLDQILFYEKIIVPMLLSKAFKLQRNFLNMQSETYFWFSLNIGFNFFTTKTLVRPKRCVSFQQDRGFLQIEFQGPTQQQF